MKWQFDTGTLKSSVVPKGGKNHGVHSEESILEMMRTVDFLNLKKGLSSYRVDYLNYRDDG